MSAWVISQVLQTAWIRKVSGSSFLQSGLGHDKFSQSEGDQPGVAAGWVFWYSGLFNHSVVNIKDIAPGPLFVKPARRRDALI